MTPPLVVDGKGDLLFFRSAREAEGYLEAQDVLNHEYPRAFDSEGRLLRLTVREQKRRVLGLFKLSSDDVVLEEAEGHASYAGDLRELLISRVGSLTPETGALEAQTLQRLLELAVRHFGYR